MASPGPASCSATTLILCDCASSGLLATQAYLRGAAQVGPAAEGGRRQLGGRALGAPHAAEADRVAVLGRQAARPVFEFGARPAWRAGMRMSSFIMQPAITAGTRHTWAQRLFLLRGLPGSSWWLTSAMHWCA